MEILIVYLTNFLKWFHAVLNSAIWPDKILISIVALFAIIAGVIVAWETFALILKVVRLKREGELLESMERRSRRAFDDCMRPNPIASMIVGSVCIALVIIIVPYIHANYVQWGMDSPSTAQITISASSPAAGYDASKDPRKVMFDVENESRKTLAQILGGIAAFVAFYFFMWQKNRLEQEGQITDRLSKAVEQLGNSALSIRFGGIYALERIARDSAADHWSVMQVLTAYVREKTKPKSASGMATMASSPTETGEKEEITPPTDIQAILTMIALRDHVDMEERGGKRLDLSNCDLRGAYLGKKDEREINLQRINFSNSDLAKANLRRVNLDGADLREANLDGADLREAKLPGADLTGAKLQGAYLLWAKLPGADLTGAKLQGAYLRGVNLDGADLSGANLQGADLREANFQQGADLSGANLQGADLRWAKLQRADLSGANLQGAFLYEANLQGADLSGAKILGASFDTATIDGLFCDSIDTTTDADWGYIIADVSASIADADLREQIVNKISSAKERVERWRENPPDTSMFKTDVEKFVLLNKELALTNSHIAEKFLERGRGKEDANDPHRQIADHVWANQRVNNIGGEIKARGKDYLLEPR
jgi:uncharacterized protein YjbI with pentapeptide repeats